MNEDINENNKKDKTIKYLIIAVIIFSILLIGVVTYIWISYDVTNDVQEVNEVEENEEDYDDEEESDKSEINEYEIESETKVNDNNKENKDTVNNDKSENKNPYIKMGNEVLSYIITFYDEGKNKEVYFSSLPDEYILYYVYQVANLESIDLCVMDGDVNCVKVDTDKYPNYKYTTVAYKLSSVKEKVKEYFDKDINLKTEFVYNDEDYVFPAACYGTYAGPNFTSYTIKENEDGTIKVTYVGNILYTSTGEEKYKNISYDVTMSFIDGDSTNVTLSNMKVISYVKIV